MRRWKQSNLFRRRVNDEDEKFEGTWLTLNNSS